MINHYPVWPPNNGGRIRILNLAKPLSRFFDVTILCLMGIREFISQRQPIRRIPLGSSVTEIDVAGSFLKALVLGPLYLKGYDGLDSFLSVRALSMGPFATRLADATKDADIVIMEHPYLSLALTRAIKDGGSKARIIYDAIDVELIRVLSQNLGHLFDPLISRRVWHTEKTACSISHAIFATTTQDCSAIRRIYNVNHENVFRIPIALDTEAIKPPSENQKEVAKDKLGLKGDEILITYLASAALHNVRVLTQVLGIASEFRGRFKNVKFYVGGSATTRIGSDIPHNVIVGGPYTFGDPNIHIVLQATDVALSLDVKHKTGTPVKTLEYMAHGLPVITTLDESERVGLKDDFNVRVASLQNMPETVGNLVKDEDTRTRLGAKGRRFVKENHDMIRCGEKALAAIQGILV